MKTDPVPPRSGRLLPDPRLAIALCAAKLTAAVIRRLGRGGGTAAPGLIAHRLDPRLVAKLTRHLPDGVIVVAGTNGKTTTARMLADMLQASGQTVVHNRSGSNLVRGVTAALATQATIWGHPRATIGLFETDEAAFGEIVRLAQPRVILLNNLFRDQLDRYGELNSIATRWSAVLAQLPATTRVVVNVDDPALAEITSNLAAQRLGFGLQQSRYRLSALPHGADAATCRRCGHDLTYNALYLSHLGEWHCPNCANARPPLDVIGGDIELDGVNSLRLTVTGPDGRAATNLEVGVPGLYNAYNAVAAVAVARVLGFDDITIRDALGKFQSAFGRIERVRYRDRSLTLALVKNPVGFNEVLRMLTGASAALTVPTMIIINDLAADGRDVSWLWDVDFEQLERGTALVATAGLRGTDMANRLKYAGLSSDRIISLEGSLREALEHFLAALPEGGTGYILPTYTAMLELRRVLTDLGAVEAFWQT